jgi:hypothetical protein
MHTIIKLVILYLAIGVVFALFNTFLLADFFNAFGVDTITLILISIFLWPIQIINMTFGTTFMIGA